MGFPVNNITKGILMKVILGDWSGRNFFMPEHIRPTQNILRKAVFDIIAVSYTHLTLPTKRIV